MKVKKISYFIGFLGLSVIIIFHEFGHFLAAKLFGLATPIFSIGFGPALLSYNIGETVFQFAALPFGGYVLLDPAQLTIQPYLVKLIIGLAGIFFNGVFAYIMFVLLLLQGSYNVTRTIQKVVENSPADLLGLHAGDEIIAYEGQEIKNTPEFIAQLGSFIHKSPEKVMDLTIKRNNEKMDVKITTAKNHPLLGKGHGWLGIVWQQKKIKSNSLLSSLKEAFVLFWHTLQHISSITTTLFSQSKKSKITGPIGIMSNVAKNLQFGLQYFLLSLGIISINIGLFNLLPLPFLDGGQIVRFTIETIFGPLPFHIVIAATLLIFFALLYIVSFFVKETGQEN